MKEIKVIKRDTIQKRLILDAVKTLDIHATAEQVYEYIVKTNPSVSKATVYRNLRQMASAGELLDAGLLGGVTHYDHNVHEHHHFVCNICGAVFDVECDLDLVLRIKDSVAQSAEFEVENYNLSFNGACKHCKEKN